MKFGTNIATTTPREQDIFVKERERRAYYEDPFQHGLKVLIADYLTESGITCYFTMRSETVYKRDGSCLNSVILIMREIEPKNYNLKFVRQQIKDIINKHFYKLFL